MLRIVCISFKLITLVQAGLSPGCIKGAPAKLFTCREKLLACLLCFVSDKFRVKGTCNFQLVGC